MLHRAQVAAAGAVILFGTLPGCMTLKRPSISPSTTSTSDEWTYPYNWKLWPVWECSAKWNEYCEGEQFAIMTAPPWQICKTYWTVTNAGRGRPIFNAFYEDIAKHPDGSPLYTKVRFWMLVQGSGDPLNRWGSNIRVEKIGAILIFDNETNARRKAWGCDGV